MIRGLVPKGRLLEWSADEGWEPLCKFLGKEVPKQPFPRANAQAGGWQDREEQCRKTWCEKAFFRMFLLIIVTVLGLIYLLSHR